MLYLRELYGNAIANYRLKERVKCVSCVMNYSAIFDAETWKIISQRDASFELWECEKKERFAPFWKYTRKYNRSSEMRLHETFLQVQTFDRGDVQIAKFCSACPNDRQRWVAECGSWSINGVSSGALPEPHHLCHKIADRQMVYLCLPTYHTGSRLWLQNHLTSTTKSNEKKEKGRRRNKI